MSLRGHRIAYCIRRVCIRSYNHATIGARTFTYSALNRSIYRQYPPSRPQLSFLSETIASPRQDFLPARSLTTDQKEWIRYQIRLGLYWAVMGWICVGGVFVSYFVLREDWLDRKYPSPKEWPWFARYSWRQAEHEMDNDGLANLNWTTILAGYQYATVVAERGGVIQSWSTPVPANVDVDWGVPGLDRTAIEAEPAMPVSEIGKIGPDISDKSEEWRRAYFTAVMGYARAAEMQYNLVVDTTRHIVFPKEQVIGASNPYPKPIRPGSRTMEPPHEENCKPIVDSPELIYQHMLTSKGFSRRQLIKIGLAYAAWLEYVGRAQTAFELCRWSLALACEGVPNSSRIVNAETGAIHSQAPFVTSNILDAATGLAAHEVHNGKIPSALNIYSSILRARHESPDAPTEKQYQPQTPDLSLKSVESIVGWLTSLHKPAEMTKEHSSGDEPFERTKGDDCEEAALMAYVGEIIFARTTEASNCPLEVPISQSPSESSLTKKHRPNPVPTTSNLPRLTNKAKSEARISGLAWTRKAVETAEESYQDQKLDRASRIRCVQCLEAGFENWHRMVKYLAVEESLENGEGAKHNGKGSLVNGWFQWLPFWGSYSEEAVASKNEGWKYEEEVVAARKEKFFEQRIMEQLNAEINLRSDWFVA